jgi:phosphinothricin acetyltransferase
VLAARPFPDAMQLRAATTDDVAAMQAIYAHHVRNGLGTFETEPPHYNEMRQRFASVVDAGFPYLVAVDGGEVLGYAYANYFRTRPAYRHTVEDSIYVRADFAGRGVGTALLKSLIERCTALGWRQMLAVIGDSGNAASIGVHRRCGFALVGTMLSIGRKFDRWVDVVVMQRALGDGASTPPAQ